ncbi:MAG: RNA polymerase factor sigma-54 [Prevotellaceae bacterium]|nr:RNA polymerase factor sigma-54 [Candidatus Colivivens equi]
MSEIRLIQTQTERQLQKLSPQQVLFVRLLEMPVMELEKRVNNEVIDNIALESSNNSENNTDTHTAEESNLADDGYTDVDKYANVLYDSDDERDDDYYNDNVNYNTYEVDVSDTQTLRDELESQIAETDLSEYQRQILEYLIGSLDEHGFLDSSLSKIEDDLLIYMNMSVSQHELKEVLSVLQQFDPVGIGARNLQECLLIQLNRLRESTRQSNIVIDNAVKIIEQHYDLFISKKTPLIASLDGISEAEVKKACALIAKLNPSPGRALNESMSDRVQTVVPDVIIETDMNGNISFVINDGNIPNLEVSKYYIDQIQSYQKHADKMNVQMREAYAYTKQKVENARMFIESIRQRHNTLMVTMKAIIKIQRNFILTQDKHTIVPMTLGDVSKITGMDISTISRVKNSKYALLDGNIYPISTFFLRARNNAEGEAVIGFEVNDKIKYIIEHEDTTHPHSDQEIEAILKRQGLNISRRTVAKYRKQLGFPIASKRR